MINDKPDYATLWIDMQAETRMMHNYLLQSRWAEAAGCAGKCKKISGKLIDWCEKMELFGKAP